MRKVSFDLELRGYADKISKFVALRIAKVGKPGLESDEQGEFSLFQLPENRGPVWIFRVACSWFSPIAE